ncbi:WbqC family protein [Prochlorococcus sp. AH-736-B04]|nr:WbqC family protein [Prochlorococcus sp. AH-736-B04]
MQPYFFPYIGYFQLMHYVDEWIIFDDTQFIDKGWINRNRILHPDIDKEWQFITIPLKSRGQFDKINIISIDSSKNWESNILGKLTAYKKKAPFYKQTIDFIKYCFSNKNISLSEFLTSTLKKTAEYIGIRTPLIVQSSLDIKIDKVDHPGQWALKIATELKADEYINPIGGRKIFKKEEFENENIKLRFIETLLEPYSQRRNGFIEGLSIIDIMMWNDQKNIYKLLSKNLNII